MTRTPPVERPKCEILTWRCEYVYCREWTGEGAHVRGACPRCGTRRGETTPSAAPRYTPELVASRVRHREIPAVCQSAGHRHAPRRAAPTVSPEEQYAQRVARVLQGPLAQQLARAATPPPRRPRRPPR